MDILFISDVFDAMYSAGRIAGVVPKLPPHVQNGQAGVLFTLYKLSQKQEHVKVTDISKHQHVTSPSIIKLLNSCVACGFVTKHRDEHDKRVVYVELTPAGLDVINHTFGPYHELVAKKLSKKYTQQQLSTMIDMIFDVYGAIRESSAELDHRLR